MRDPDHGLLQQMNAKPISGEHLEVLGQKAASAWRSGKVGNLTDAVVQTVKHAGLSPEQVRRVVEFANTDAFLKEFRKEGAASKYVDFGQGGPADPGDVLRDLNDGGQPGTPGIGDYLQQPQSKIASAISDDEFYAAIGGSGTPEAPFANPFGDAIALREKLAGAYEHMTSELSGSERVLEDAINSVYDNVKQATLNGYSIGEVLRAWHSMNPPAAYVKVAFSFITPKLVEEKVFRSPESVGQSIEKVGSAGGVVNKDHPLMQNFGAFCGALEKTAHIQMAREEIALALGQIEGFLKAAEKGLWGKARDAAAELAPRAAGHAANLTAKVTGTGTRVPLTVGHAVNNAVRYAPHAAAGVGAYHLYQRAQELSSHPVARQALSLVPYTDANRQEHARRMMEAAGYDPNTGYGY